METKKTTIRILQFFLLACFVGFSNIDLQAQPQPQTISNLRTRRQLPIRRAVIPLEIQQLQLDTIPNLVGMKYNEDEIRTFLDVLGLELGDAIPAGDNRNIGLITSQSPPAGSIKTANPVINITFGIRVRASTLQPEIVVVPSYVGMTEARAFGRMSNDRLSRGMRREINSDLPIGIVVAQFPDANMKVDPGTRIDLEVSKGPAQETLVIVPRLIGVNLQYAAEILRKTGLFAGNLVEKISNKPEGTVIGQSPQPGAEVAEGSMVNITFSIHPDVKLVSVPFVKKLPRDKAIHILKESRLNYSIEYVDEPSQSAGIVVNQNPSPETMVAPGTRVTIFVQDDNDILPPWIFWAGAFLLVGLLGGSIVKRKIKNGKKGKRVAGGNTKLRLKVVWDSGEQRVSKSVSELSRFKLNLKIIPDRGEQTLKIN